MLRLRQDRRLPIRAMRWALASLLACVSAACQLPPPMAPNQTTAATAAHSPKASVPLASGELRIRLAAQEEKLELHVGGTALGSLSFSAQGDSIRSSQGELQKEFRLQAIPGSRGLELDGRFYNGSLVIELHENQGLRVENHVPVEDYIAGVVPSELVLWSAQESEIEAQAIAARTYALRSLAKRRSNESIAFLWDDTRDQVYLGNFQGGPSPAAQRVEARYRRAMASSAGRIALSADGQLYDVRFHASCGGNACSPAEAFPTESKLRHAPVTCAPCATIGEQEKQLEASDTRRRRVHWNWTADPASLAQAAHALGVGTRIIALYNAELDGHGRWQSVEIQGDQTRLRVSIESLRRELGPARLKGTLILGTWPPLGQVIEGGLYFEGLGRGHGAGLCQVGSHEYARQGWSAQQILQHYLPGARIASLPTP